MKIVKEGVRKARKMRNGGRGKGGGGFERVSEENYGKSMVMEKFRVRKNDDEEEEEEEDERTVRKSILGG